MRDGRNGSGGAEGGRGRSAEAGRRTRGERGPMVRLEVSALSSDGAGIARTANGVVFVTGALPGESVTAEKFIY